MHKDGSLSRRGVLMGIGAGTLGLAGCANGVGSGGGSTIDARVDATRDYLFANFPGTRDLAMKSTGILYMPLMTEAGFGVGGGFGQGALRINDITVDYYSAARASIGFQIGAQQYGHALFFLTEGALGQFRYSDGWNLGAEARYAVPDHGGSIGRQTAESAPVVALIFGQQGLIAGATLSGIKYTRIIP